MAQLYTDEQRQITKLTAEQRTTYIALIQAQISSMFQRTDSISEVVDIVLAAWLDSDYDGHRLNDMEMALDRAMQDEMDSEDATWIQRT